MAAQLARSSCVFCASTDMSGEHLYPDWIRRIFPTSGRHRHSTVDRTYANQEDIWAIKPKVMSHKRALHQVRLYVVCKSCNNGWMSRLEQDAKPILNSLIEGRSFTPSSAQRAILIRWAQKTAIVAEAGHCAPLRALSVSEPERQLAREGRPTDSWKIWIGTAKRQTMGTVVHSRTVASDTGAPNRADSLFVIGELIVRARFSAIPFGGVPFSASPFRPNDDLLANRLLVRFHPPTVRQVWPPSVRVAPEHLMMLIAEVMRG